MKSKNIPHQERLIVALDVPNVQEAKKIVMELGGSCTFYKVGLQLAMTQDYFPFIDWLIKHGKKVFADIKFFDVPTTVFSAVRQLNQRGITYTTVHGNDSILRAAIDASEDVKILAVTVLTSLDHGDIQDLGFSCSVEQLVLSRAKRALAIGCHGIISSGLEAAEIRRSLGDKLLVVIPGIRPVENIEDDQKRTVDVKKAFLCGADYIVVGRPIRLSSNPRLKAEKIQDIIASLFSQ